MSEQEIPDQYRKLVERVNELGRQVNELAETGGNLKAEAEHNGGTVLALALQVEDLAERLATVEAVLEDKRPKGQPDWILAGDKDEALRWLDSLRAWVDKVFAVHTGRALPDCWIWHPRAVEELLAMQAHRTFVHASPNATLLSDYQTRFLDAAVKRLVVKSAGQASILSKCVEEGVHVDPELGVPPHMVTRFKVDRGAINAYVGWWTTDRKGRPPGLIDAS